MMDYGDTTVMIPVKDEPATESVVKAVFAALPNCKIIVVYKGNLNLSLKHKNLKIVCFNARKFSKGHSLL